MGREPDLQCIRITHATNPIGEPGSLQYCHHFNPQDDDVSSLTDISWNSHHFPTDFLADLFGYEDWGDTYDAHLYFPPAITRAPDSELPTLSVWCPEDSADPSPDHSITICNSSDAPFSCSGPSLCLAIVLTLLTLRFSLTSFLVFSSAGWLFGPWKSFRSGKPLKTLSML